MKFFYVNENPLPTIITGMEYFLAAKATMSAPEFAITAPFFSMLSADIITLCAFLTCDAISVRFI